MHGKDRVFTYLATIFVIASYVAVLKSLQIPVQLFY